MTDAPDPTRLRAIPRAENRSRLAIDAAAPPFRGADLWTAYELSWLNRRGRPEVRVAHLEFPCRSEFLIESKSLKLYLAGFSQRRFESPESVEDVVRNDLSARAGAAASVRLESLGEAESRGLSRMPGECIDSLDIDVTDFAVAPSHLAADPSAVVSESLYSDLLKSNCPATGNPDWGSLLVRYTGPRIAREGLLRYIVSYREHAGFHEDCVERMFVEITARCRPEKLLVYARYLRRGGLDINPYRSSSDEPPEAIRLARQ